MAGSNDTGGTDITPTYYVGWYRVLVSFESWICWTYFLWPSFSKTHICHPSVCKFGILFFICLFILQLRHAFFVGIGSPPISASSNTAIRSTTDICVLLQSSAVCFFRIIWFDWWRKKNKTFDTFFVSYLVGRVLYRRKKASLSYFSLFLLFFPFFFIRLWYQWNTVFFLCFHLQAINLPRTHPFEVAGNGPEVPPLCCFSLDARHGTGWNQLLWRTQSVCLLITSDRMTHPNLCVFFFKCLECYQFFIIVWKEECTTNPSFPVSLFCVALHISNIFFF